MTVLTPLTSIAPIFFSAYFLILLIVTVVVTVLINFGIDLAVNMKDDTVAVVGPATGINILVFTVIVAVLCFFGTKSLQQRILKGHAAPVVSEALKANFFLRYVLFSTAVPNWKVRLPRFIAQCMLFPGVFVVIVVVFICWCTRNFAPLEKESCVVPRTEFLLWTELWKGVSVAIVYTANYMAAHNVDQPEIQAGDPLLHDAAKAGTIDYSAYT